MSPRRTVLPASRSSRSVVGTGRDHQPKENIVANDELRFDVEEELIFEPRVDNEAIAVSTDDGDVTLRGTVGSFREKREAANAAKRVYGVTKVDTDHRRPHPRRRAAPDQEGLQARCQP